MGGSKKAVKYGVVDAFTGTPFKGNPAAVCLLEDDRDEVWLQSLATEFNLSETCFLTPISSNRPNFRLRWFTPVAEVELCGHATLAASHYLFSSDLVEGNTVEFSTLSGILTAKKVLQPNGDKEERFLIELDFPALTSTEYPGNETSFLSKVTNNATVIDVREIATKDTLAIFQSVNEIIDYQPNYEDIRELPSRGLVISAAASSESGFDFYSRFFCPKMGINEDPVCGSAHCALALYWSKKLGKSDFIAYQASPRSGILKLHLDEQNNRVQLQGEGVTVMEGFILV